MCIIHDSSAPVLIRIYSTSGKSLASDCLLIRAQVCKDTLVGDAMKRGISGGQRKRVTLGEAMVGPKTGACLRSHAVDSN